MIEYIGNIIKLDKGINEVIANITDEAGNAVTEGCAIEIDGVKDFGSFDGQYWHFEIDTTKKETGKYYYRIFSGDNAISFEEPLYIVGC